MGCCRFLIHFKRRSIILGSSRYHRFFIKVHKPRTNNKKSVQILLLCDELVAAIEYKLKCGKRQPHQASFVILVMSNVIHICLQMYSLSSSTNIVIFYRPQKSIAFLVHAKRAKEYGKWRSWQASFRGGSWNGSSSQCSPNIFGSVQSVIDDDPLSLSRLLVVGKITGTNAIKS